MKRLAILVLAALLLPTAAWADDDAERELKADVVLRALVDELDRNQGELELEDLERPYFIEYALLDSAGASVTAELGAVTSKGDSRGRILRTDVRVGSYELDNTNFSGGGGGRFFFGRSGGGMRMSAIPIEDDYDAIRQSIWWATDREYKSVVETLAEKKAFMESKLIEDKPADFSHEQPAVHFDGRIEAAVDVAQLEELAVTLSAIFREFPDIQSSSVTVSAAAGNKYLVNTEGTRLRSAGRRYSLSVNARVQADDGMRLADSFALHVREPGQWPTVTELSQRCRDMAERLIKVKNAPVLDESYTGPVLFKPEAATEIFARQFSSRFSGGQRPVGSNTDPDDFANKLNKRILPRSFHVVDDPTQETFAGVSVMGHYEYDDQGVPARPVNLVESGRLKALLMSRNPSKEFAQSTGHGRGLFGPNASVGCLIVTDESPTSAEDLTKELLEACADEDLEYGIRIEAMRGGGSRTRRGRYAGGSNPLVMYKVYPDGREEMVRGALLGRIDLNAFKRMLAAGDTLYVHNTSGRSEGRTVAAPAMLFEELDLAKIDRDFDKPPILPTPLARPVEE